MKKIYIALVFFISTLSSQAQQFALYNSRTLWDTFENPSQKAFVADTSRKYAFNFFIPTISIHAAFSGPMQKNIQDMMLTSKMDINDLSLNKGQNNILSEQGNIYLLQFRMLNNVNVNGEMGFAWQVRTDGFIKFGNATLAILDDYNRFDQGQYQDIFNNKGYHQSYHQFSFTYRENVDKRLALGAKISLLSGISHNKLKITKSSLNINHSNQTVSVYLKGKYQSSFDPEDPDMGPSILYPDFTNPGLAFSISGNYRFRDGWFLLGNLKDVGLILWNDKGAYQYHFDKTATIQANSKNNNNNNDPGSQVKNELDKVMTQDPDPGKYLSLINGKAEALLSKDFGFYQPNFILSKNLFYPGGDIAVVNNFRYNQFVLAASAGYNTNNYLQIGGQFMVKSPNAEFFIGSDQLLKTYQLSKSLIQQVNGNGYLGAAFYLGLAFKFGPVLEHRSNASYIPVRQ